MKEEQDINRGFAEQVIAALRASPEERAPEGTRIDVHAAVSRFAVLYERIRTAIDYKDEHLLRKAAILRILKRQLVLERDAEAVASNVIRELISAGYFPNNELPESLIRDVADPVSKYQSIERTRIGSPSHLAWLRRVIASEIEELLVDSRREKALVALLYERLVDRLRVTGAMKIDEIDLRLQIYLACHRAFLKSDEDTLSYKLLRAYLPEWLRPPEWVENSVAVAERLVGVERRIHASLRHPLGPRIQRAVKPWAVSFQLLVEALAEKPEEAAHLIDHPESLRAVVARLADRQYRVAKGKLRRGAFRAIIYIFVTKMLIAFALEVPIEKALYGETSVPTLAVNLLFPPVMMFIVALFIRIPGRENTERLQANAATLLSTAGVPEREIRVPRPRSAVGTLLFGLLYAALYLLIFGLIATGLLQLHFTWVSIAVFLFFLCTVSFFAFRLRQNARENVIVNGRERLRSVIVDLVSLPILRVGLLLSRGISRLNVFLFFFDFLLEAPFKLFLAVLEEWFSYLKEKKEELS